MLFIIHTESKKYYIMNNHGELTQYNSNYKPDEYKFSGKWKVAGISKILPFGRIGAVENILNYVGKDLRYKNGRGAYVLHDWDHGTRRTWGDRITGIYIDYI